MRQRQITPSHNEHLGFPTREDEAYSPQNTHADIDRFIGTPIVNSFNRRSGDVTLTGVDVTTALGYTPVNRAGDTMTGALVVEADVDVDGTLTAAGNIVLSGDLHQPGVTGMTLSFEADGIHLVGGSGSDLVNVQANLVVNAGFELRAPVLEGTDIGDSGARLRARDSASVFSVDWSGSALQFYIDNNPVASPGGAPSGPAGGVLSGTYPNPGMASGAAVANIGYTPVNRAGDTMSGDLFVRTGTAGIKVGLLDATEGAWLRNNGFDMVLSSKVGDAYYGYLGRAGQTHYFMTDDAVRVAIDSTGVDVTVPLYIETFPAMKETDDAGGDLTGTYPNPTLAAGASVANIGYTPLNQAGGTMSGNLGVRSGVAGISIGDASLSTIDGLRLTNDGTFGVLAHSAGNLAFGVNSPSFYQWYFGGTSYMALSPTGGPPGGAGPLLDVNAAIRTYEVSALGSLTALHFFNGSAAWFQGPLEIVGNLHVFSGSEVKSNHYRGTDYPEAVLNTHNGVDKVSFDYDQTSNLLDVYINGTIAGTINL